VADQLAHPTPGAAFREGHVEADGFRIRYMEAGDGPAVVHLHGAGGLRLSPGHDLLAQRHRVIAFEMPGFGHSPENTASRDMADLAATMGRAVANLGIDRYNLWGTSFGGKVSLWLAVQASDNIMAIVLEAPAAIRAPGTRAPSGTPEEMARALFAHPERVPPMPPQDPEIRAKIGRLTQRLMGPNRDPSLERRLREMAVPTLVLFGTADRVIPPEMGHFYKELMPNCHLVFVYDAGHAIATDRPEAFAEVASDFIERHEAFVISRTPTVINP
jgi:pimeloyl-ACP methyl ester carboxylesterase